MSRAENKRFRLGVYLTLVGLVGVVTWAVYHGNNLSEVIPVAHPASDLKVKAIDLYAENTTTLSSYTMLVLTGVGFFVHLIFSKDNTAIVTRRRKLLLIGTVAACVASLLSGYFCYGRMIELLANGLVFDPSASRVFFFHQSQFWCFLGSIMLFGIFAVEVLVD